MPVVPLRSSCPCGCYHPPGTPCPPSPPSCQPVISQMPMGVTDGSNALPGQVGEWFAAQATIAYQEGVAVSQTVSVGTLPPGDWDAWTFLEINPATSGGNLLDSVDYYLSPTPAGFSQPLGQAWFTGDPSASIDVVLVSGIGRANTTVPTALVFQIYIQTTSGTGSVNLIVNARRMR